MRGGFLAIVFFIIFGASNAIAQGRSPQELRSAASIATDLSYPDKVSEFGFFSSPRDLQNSRTQVNYLHAGIKNEGEHRLEGWKIRVSNHELGAHR